MNKASLKSDQLPVVVLSLAEYERMQEDLAMLESKDLAKTVARARREIKQGQTLSLDELKAELKF